MFGVKNKMTKRTLCLLQETCGPEQKEHHCRKKFRSMRIFCQTEERLKDTQIKIEKIEGELLHSGSFRFMTLPRFGS